MENPGDYDIDKDMAGTQEADETKIGRDSPLEIYFTFHFSFRIVPPHRQGKVQTGLLEFESKRRGRRNDFTLVHVTRDCYSHRLGETLAALLSEAYQRYLHERRVLWLVA